MDEKKLQKEVERVRKKGYLEVTIRFDAKKYLEKPDHTSFSKNCWEEGQIVFLLAQKILEAYRKKYG